MGSHPELKEIDLNKNRIGELPEESFKMMPKLESFQLKGNHIKSFPSSICSDCPHLTMLNLSDCKELANMPDNIGECAKLKTVFWANTGVANLPDSFEKLVLVRADLSCAEGSQLNEKSLEMCARMKEKLVAPGTAESDGFFRY